MIRCAGSMYRIKFGYISVLLLAALISCAPVREWNPLDYSVKSGDTLYSIAWRYEKDFQDIARWNNIPPPYAIYPGQRLKLAADDASGSAGREQITPEQTVTSTAIPVIAAVIEPLPTTDVAGVRPETVVVQKGDTLYAIAQQTGLSQAQLARWNALHPPYQLSPGQVLRLSAPGTRLAQIKAAESTPAIVIPVKPASTPIASTQRQADPVETKTIKLLAVTGWSWPVKGPVIKTFRADDTSRKGIGIAGKAGQPVMAAAAGRVVYSGNGLISYGNLIIIKHDDNFLSAYAHNQALLVAEGDDVKPDQPIARMGEDNGRAQLHFEIRKNGKPVNPLQYLPQS